MRRLFHQYFLYTMQHYDIIHYIQNINLWIFYFPDKITKSNLYESYQAQNSINDINFFDSYF